MSQHDFGCHTVTVPNRHLRPTRDAALTAAHAVRRHDRSEFGGFTRV